MMEIQLQAELCKEARSQGGFAFKMSNRFLVGVPDLFCQIPSLRTTLLEIKIERRQTPLLEAKLTEHQKNYLQRINDSGGVAGWATFVPKGRAGNYIVYVGRYDMSPRFTTTRGHGEKWPIFEIVKGINELRR